MKNTVAHTILEQLGGRRFIMMTGAKKFVGSHDGLTFRLPGAGGFCLNGINAVRIVLDPSDTYTVTFYRLRGLDMTVISTHTDIYCDSLAGLVSKVTGLAVRF